MHELQHFHCNLVKNALRQADQALRSRRALLHKEASPGMHVGSGLLNMKLGDQEYMLRHECPFQQWDLRCGTTWPNVPLQSLSFGSLQGECVDRLEGPWADGAA